MSFLLTKFFSPLEQFEIYTIASLPVGAQLYNQNPLLSIPQFFFLVLTSSNALLTSFIIICLLIFFIHITYYNYTLLNSFWLNGVNTYFNTIKTIISDLVSHPIGKNYYFVFFAFVFMLINIVNVLGLIPYTFVLTSQFFFTFGLAFIFFVTLNLTGIILHGFGFLNLFYPSGTPIFIVPLLVLIEFISYIARVFSLAIRLFANITAGHILVKILSWLTWMVLDIFMISGISFIIISALWVLEFFISILQAYVSLTLLCLYLNDVLQLH
jgi:ATP synthase subunit 6